MSYILAPAHKATFSVMQLPAMMRLFDGKAILRYLCGLAGYVPVAVVAEIETE